MICTYCLVEEKSKDKVIYGIKAVNIEGDAVAIYKDVNLSRAKAENLVRRCNIGRLYSRHLLDVICDTIKA